MFAADLPVEDQLAQLEAVLGFDWDDQDWGIVNADGGRVKEFLEFFDQKYDETWAISTVAEYVDLVLESANQALHADPTFPGSTIDRFVATTAPIAPAQMAYWTSREGPITLHLRELGL